MEINAVNLTKTFGVERGVTSLNFKFDKPGLVGYLGPNGAGKTTTLKLFSNLLFPTSGEALVNGINVREKPAEALSNISTLVESPEPYPHQTASEFLHFVGKIRGMSYSDTEARIKELSDQLHLESLTKRTGKMSKGNKQRVMLAATFLPDSDLLLLDEPTGGLDPAEAKDVRNVLKEMKKEKLILMSSHLLYEVTDVADDIIFINGGKILLIDTVENVSVKFGGKNGTEGLEETYIKLIREGTL
ncbi:MAG: ABC transporter ATP-binding protein [Thermoplasmataceae archaeon]